MAISGLRELVKSPMSLFDVDIPDADLGYQNIRRAAQRIELELKEALEALWQRYEPYADTHFVQQFAREPYARFWEMYLTTQLLDEGKNVRPRSELPAEIRNTGPDILIREEERTIWIEAITPEPGELANVDRVPEIVPISEGGGAQAAPRRQVELRITGALLQKREAFQQYRERGLVAEHNFCVVAISGSRFSAQSVATDLPRAVTAVYPLGDRYVTFDRGTVEVVDTGYRHSEHINRSSAEPIPRYAFLHDHFSDISGLIWSRRTIGNFLGRGHDFVFVHNVTARDPFPTGWITWDEEEIIRSVGDRYELTRVKARDLDP